MRKRRKGLGGPIRLIVSMYQDDPMVFYLFVVGLCLFVFASGLLLLMKGF